MKKSIKKVLKQIIKILIALFDNNKTYSFDVNQAKKELNNTYEYRNYDLTNCIKNISSYNYDLSIIVPVYNAEKYLNECVDSLLNQETKYKYEIICVNDGSIDESTNILNNYHSDKLKIIHQENKGISGARNAGLNISTGRYVGFVDNDDYVKNNYVEELLNNAYSNEADYVKCSYTIVDDKYNNVIDRKIYENITYLDLNNTHINHDVLSGYMWGGCYKREIWNDFCFPVGYWFEDMIKSMYLYNRINVLSCITKTLYIKRKHKNNAADNLWKKENVKSLDQLYLVEAIEELKKQRSIINTKITYECMLFELGEYLYKRTNKLPQSIRKDAFIVASSIIKKSKNYFLDKKSNYKEYYFQKSLLNSNYRLWKLICLYCRY